MKLMKTYLKYLWASLKINKFLLLFLLGNLILFIIAHLPWLREDVWGWRPAQTLLTTYWYKQEGISLLSYQTPVYGPPWQVPFEFPLYQAVSTIISNLLSIGIKAASHITSLLTFFTSAIFLFLIGTEYFSNVFTASVIFTVYVWFPFDFFYSNEIMIDYMALAFALGYIYLALKWFARPTNIALALLAIFFLSLGSLVKITTIPIIVFPFLFMVFRYLKDQEFTFKRIVPFILTHKTFVVLLILMVLIPLGLTYLWTNYCDQIKLANPSTVWLTSKNLATWNYGTLQQKLSLKNWWSYILKIRENFFFGGSILFLILTLILTIKAPSKARHILISCIFGSLLTIFIFFNLYKQTQYYIAISAFMSILAGYSLSWVIQETRRKNNIWSLFLFIVIFGLIVEYPGIEQFKKYRQVVDYYLVNSGANYTRTAKIARRITPGDGYVISIQYDWSPELAVRLERKEYILSGRNSELFNCNLVTGLNYTTVIGPADSPLTQKALACFNHYEEVSPNIFSVSKSP